jgi:hypothetical protein
MRTKFCFFVFPFVKFLSELSSVQISTTASETFHFSNGRFYGLHYSFESFASTAIFPTFFHLNNGLFKNFSQVTRYNFWYLSFFQQTTWITVDLPTEKVTHGHADHEGCFANRKNEHLFRASQIESLIIEFHKVIGHYASNVPNDAQVHFC